MKIERYAGTEGPLGTLTVRRCFVPRQLIKRTTRLRRDFCWLRDGGAWAPDQACKGKYTQRIAIEHVDSCDVTSSNRARKFLRISLWRHSMPRAPLPLRCRNLRMSPRRLLLIQRLLGWDLSGHLRRRSSSLQPNHLWYLRRHRGSRYLQHRKSMAQIRSHPCIVMRNCFALSQGFGTLGQERRSSMQAMP